MTSINSKTKAAANIRKNGAEFMVTFGHMDGVEFVCAPSRPSRFYKTKAGALRAVKAWTKR